jgi:hypothetical protein
MLNIELKDVLVETESKPILTKTFGQKDTRWCASIALRLIHNDTDAIAEWFYLFACSPEYIDHPVRKGLVPSRKFTIIQNEFNIEAIEQIARDKLKSIKPNNWDEFYAQMSKEFLYED